MPTLLSEFRNRRGKGILVDTILGPIAALFLFNLILLGRCDASRNTGCHTVGCIMEHFVVTMHGATGQTMEWLEGGTVVDLKLNRAFVADMWVPILRGLQHISYNAMQNGIGHLGIIGIVSGTSSDRAMNSWGNTSTKYTSTSSTGRLEFGNIGVTSSRGTTKDVAIGPDILSYVFCFLPFSLQLILIRSFVLMVFLPARFVFWCSKNLLKLNIRMLIGLGRCVWKGHSIIRFVKDIIRDFLNQLQGNLRAVKTAIGLSKVAKRKPVTSTANSPKLSPKDGIEANSPGSQQGAATTPEDRDDGYLLSDEPRSLLSDDGLRFLILLLFGGAVFLMQTSLTLWVVSSIFGIVWKFLDFTLDLLHTIVVGYLRFRFGSLINDPKTDGEDVYAPTKKEREIILTSKMKTRVHRSFDFSEVVCIVYQRHV